MSVDLQIREQIALFLLGQIDTEELEAWLAEVTWDIDSEPASTRHAAFRALRLLTETANGDWTADELRTQLTTLLQTLSPVPPVSGRGEGLLEKLSEAERRARERQSDENPEEALTQYVAFSTEESFGSWQSSDRAFLRQPKGESDTPPPSAAELAID